MLELTGLVTAGEPQTTLTLPLDRRVRSRQRVVLDDGREAGLFRMAPEDAAELATGAVTPEDYFVKNVIF